MASEATIGAALKSVWVPSSVRVAGTACYMTAGLEPGNHPWQSPQQPNTASGGSSNRDGPAGFKSLIKKILADLSLYRFSWEITLSVIISSLVFCLILK